MTHKRPNTQIAFLNLLGDSAALILSFAAAFFFRFHSIFPIDPRHIPHFSEYIKTLIVILPVYFFCFRAYGLYKQTRHIRRIEEIFMVIKAASLAILLLTAMSFFYRGVSYSRVTLIFLWIFSVFFISVTRYFMIQLEYIRKRSSKELINVLIIGANRNARNIIRWARNNPHYGVSVSGVLARDKDVVNMHLEGVSILGVIDEAGRFIEQLRPNEVILLDQEMSRDQITELVIACEDKFINFKIGADFFGLMTRNVDVEYISTVPLLGFRTLPLDMPVNRFIKRTFDILVSGTMLLLTMPVWVTVCILIRLENSGPILYRQKRMGRDERIFNVLKFRTMRVNAEAETGPVWTQENDNRRTGLGQFLRRWNIDELPQLFNVFRGDMSMVGPRPERPHFIKEFRDAIPRYMARHRVKSGLTGWAAVNGYRGNTSIVERTKYDLYYMENWSLLFDIEIILMTAFAFKNAY